MMKNKMKNNDEKECLDGYAEEISVMFPSKEKKTDRQIGRLSDCQWCTKWNSNMII